MEPKVVNLAEYKSTQSLQLNEIFDAVSIGPISHLNLTRKFGNLPLNDDQLCYILRSIMQDKSLEIINLNGNDIRKKACHALVETLACNKVTRLELRLNYMGDAYITTIIKALAKHKVIKYLSLATNCIGPKGFVALEHLVRVTALTHLDLMGNTLNPEGAITLAQGLKANKSLTYLDLKETGIGPKGTEAIAAAISSLPLTYLDLSYNRLIDSGAKSIAHALMNNTSLTHLKIGSVPTPLALHLNPPSMAALNSGISREGLLALGELISKSPCLSYFSLDWQKRTKPDVFQTFFGALKHNTTIIDFFCAGSTVPDNIIEDCFSVNRTITNGSGGKENPLLNKYIRTNSVCKKLSASEEERKEIPAQLQREYEIEKFLKNKRESKK